MQIIEEQIAQRVKALFEQEGTGHDWYHIERVKNNALRISEKEGGDKEIITLAALLHDISDHKFNGGDFNQGGKVSAAMLSDYNYPKSRIERVVEIVDNVSYKGSGVPDNMPSLEGKIVQDADRLDAIGAIGIARTFAYGGAVGSLLYDPTVAPKNHSTAQEYQKGRTHTINHFYEKLLLLKDRMHTPTAKQIAEERTAFMESFLERFYKEWG